MRDATGRMDCVESITGVFGATARRRNARAMASGNSVAIRKAA